MLGHDRVDVIAHSLGGLDARYALAKLGLASRVRSLVTVGTPHHGTPLAAIGEAGLLVADPQGDAHARHLRARLALAGRARALQRRGAERRRASATRAWSAASAARTPACRSPSSPIHHYLRRVAGPNDGLVPISSQYWGETLAEIEADHFAQVGWRFTARSTFDAAGHVRLDRREVRRRRPARPPGDRDRLSDFPCDRTPRRRSTGQ